MNTRIKILLFVFFIQSCNLDDKSDNDLSVRNIKGDVISLEVVSYNAIEKFGEITKGEAGWQNNQDKDSYTIFNTNGNIIQWYSYNSRGYIENKYIYEYDEIGNYIERNSYTSNGRLDSKKIYKYNDKGKIVECNNYNYNGELDYIEKYKYDNNDKIIEENWYTSDGKLVYKISYTYNDNGKKVKTIIYDSNGIIQTSLTNDYNKKGDLIVHNIYNSEGSIKTENKYNYNDKGDVVEEYTFDYIEGTEQKTINKYEYDTKGNWVSCITYINNEPKYIIQRIIGYDLIREKELINEMTLNTIVGIYTKVKENERGHSLNVFGRGLVSEIDFKEKYCTFLYFGNPMTAEFELLDNFVYIKVGGELGVLKFEITTENTLEGEGWASGTFKKGYIFKKEKSNKQTKPIEENSNNKIQSKSQVTNPEISYSLGGRASIFIPPQEDLYQKEGRVVVEISVDREGNVTEVKGGVKGSNNFDDDMVKVSEEAASKAKFDINPNAPFSQKGSITYLFTKQKNEK